jgi:hypothetical protein
VRTEALCKRHRWSTLGHRIIRVKIGNARVLSQWAIYEVRQCKACDARRHRIKAQLRAVDALEAGRLYGLPQEDLARAEPTPALMTEAVGAPLAAWPFPVSAHAWEGAAAC